jgi:hypothetical protein
MSLSLFHETTNRFIIVGMDARLVKILWIHRYSCFLVTEKSLQNRAPIVPYTVNRSLQFLFLIVLFRLFRLFRLFVEKLLHPLVLVTIE